VPRTVRDSKLETREARLRLKAGRRYFRGIGDGLALCYRRTTDGYGTWAARVRGQDGRYAFRAIGMADDFEQADDERVLSYHQANDRAREIAKEGISTLAPLTVREAAESYLEWYADHRKAYAETRAAINAHILPKLGDKTVRELTAPMLRDWHRSLATKAPRRRTRTGKPQAFGDKAATDDANRARRATANRIFTVLRAMLNKAYQDELVADDSAWRKVKPFKGADEPVIRFLTPAEATRLTNAAPVPFRHLVAGALQTGARYSELTGLTVGDFNTTTRTVYFRAGKTGRARHVPLTDEGVALFASLTAGKPVSAHVFTREDGKPWGKNHQVRPLMQACAKAKIAPAVTFHELRHTYASTLAQRGVDLLAISKLLGHADTRITARHYAHLCDDSLRAAVALLPKLGVAPDEKVRAIA
jgi:integrase